MLETIFPDLYPRTNQECACIPRGANNDWKVKKPHLGLIHSWNLIFF